MKRYLKYIFITLLLTLNSATATEINNNYLADELLQESQKNEVILDLTAPQTSVEQENSHLHPILNELLEDDGGSNLSEKDEASDNTELDFELFKNFEGAGNQKRENPLAHEIFHSKIVRTDIPSYLLQDDLTFKFEKGPLEKVQLFGAYRGGINSLWKLNHSTNYENLTTQFGMFGSFKNKDYKFKLSFKPIPKEGLSYVDNFVSDAYLVNTTIPNHQIVAGYSRVQTGIEGGTTSYILPFVARSQIAQYFGNSRSLSVKLIGKYQYLDYNLAVGSAGRYITRGFPGTEFNGWVNVKPFGDKSKKYGKLVIGGGFNGGHNRIDYSILSGYVGYNYKKLWTNFETAIANGYNGSKGISSNEACGFAYTLGWKITPHLQLIGRIDQFDPNRHNSNDLQREYTIGLNWFIKGQALKVVLNYVFCDKQSKPNSHKLILATQVLL